VKRVMRNAEERGHRVDRAIYGLSAPRHEEREPRFLTPLEVERLSSYCTEGRLIVFAALTGLRQGELFGLCRGISIYRTAWCGLSAPVVPARSERRSQVGNVSCISLSWQQRSRPSSL
jgi:hypothetical protein